MHLNLTTPTSRLSRALSILLALALLAALLPAPVALAATCDHKYQVKRNDTLKSISDKFGMPPAQLVYASALKVPYTIYVGQNLCIPDATISNPPKLDNKQLNAPAAHFTAGRSGDSILVYTYNYPKTVVLVKVDNASDSKKNLINVGTINVGSSGNGKTWRFKLPDSLVDASKLQICLKDRTTSYLQCAYPRTGG